MPRKPVVLVVLALLTIIGPAVVLMHTQPANQPAISAAGFEGTVHAQIAEELVEPISNSGHPPETSVVSVVCGTVRNPCVAATARVRVPPSFAGFTDALLNASIVTHGDTSALHRMKQKLERGEPVDVVVFGGSISRGHQLEMDAPEGTSGAVLRDQYTWGGQLVAWLNAKFPVKLTGKRHTLRNLAKPASGSKYAAEHYEQLLQPDPDRSMPPPDLVLCEFTVNDAGGCSQKDHPECLLPANRELARCKCRPHAIYTEQLIRALAQNADTAVVYVEFSTGFTQGSVLKYDQTVAQHTRVCRHYGIPQWSLREAMLLLLDHSESSTMTSVLPSAQWYWCVDKPLCRWPDGHHLGGSAASLEESCKQVPNEACPKEAQRGHPPLVGHTLVAEYIALHLQQIWRTLDEPLPSTVASGSARRLPKPLFAEAAAPLRRPSTILDFAQDHALLPNLPSCVPPEAPVGCGPPGKALIGGEFGGALRSEPSPVGWRWLDEARWHSSVSAVAATDDEDDVDRPLGRKFGLVAYYANTSQLSPRIGWYAIAIDCKVFEIQSHATIDAESLSNRLLPILYNRNFDTSCRDVIVRGANSKAMSKQTAKTALVIGYMRSYENMATAKMFLDGHLLGEVDGLWSHHSSQYNSVGFDTLVVGPGQHVLEIEVQPDLSPDKQRGLNKFKLLEILVY